MRRGAGFIVILTLVAAACTSGGDADPSGSGAASGSGAPLEITLWHGYGKVGIVGGIQNYEAKSIQDMVDAFNAEHPDIHVNDVFCCSNDNALQKLNVALQGDQQPDITYQYGTSLPQLANAPGLMDLTDRVNDAGFDWEDFFPGERDAATIDGRVLGVPAAVGNLAVVYNKDLFQQAGLQPPAADWTWDDFRADAKALTDPGTKTFGLAFPADASEDTVWHFDAMLWEAGGDILNADNTQALFNAAPGVTALTTLRDMAVTDGSMYLDEQNAKIDQLMNSGKAAMVITGPWALGSYLDANVGVQVMPSFPGGSHQTISGSDDWVLFDNGQERADAAWEFVKWMTATEQVQSDSMLTGHLPTRSSVLDQAGFLKEFGTKFPGEDVFATNLENVEKARPQLQGYDMISQAMGQAIVSVLLGEQEPQAALDEAAQQVNDLLASGA